MKKSLKVVAAFDVEIDTAWLNNPLFKKGVEDAASGTPPRKEYLEGIAYMTGRAYYNQQNPRGAPLILRGFSSIAEAEEAIKSALVP